ncbi:MAG: GNAT family N-acetyltransferase, partial [Actinobacteria bacterium]|nr:GNAT family N-acetyltransferase [Actinomycetota bacterium]
MSLRERVFCGEQGVSRAEELDGLDDGSTQIVALEGGEVIATCRLRSTGEEQKLERMAVEPGWRGAGAGRRLLAGA